MKPSPAVVSWLTACVFLAYGSAALWVAQTVFTRPAGQGLRVEIVDESGANGSPAAMRLANRGTDAVLLRPGRLHLFFNPVRGETAAYAVTALREKPADGDVAAAAATVLPPGSAIRIDNILPAGYRAMIAENDFSLRLFYDDPASGLPERFFAGRSGSEKLRLSMPR